MGDTHSFVAVSTEYGPIKQWSTIFQSYFQPGFEWFDSLEEWVAPDRGAVLNEKTTGNEWVAPEYEDESSGWHRMVFKSGIN